jgi:transcriptional regulator with XRE-family HTH domain
MEDTEYVDVVRVRHRLAANIRVARKRSELSQEDLARICMMRRSTISRIERGEQEPRVSTLVAVSRGLRVPLQVLMRGVYADDGVIKE